MTKHPKEYSEETGLRENNENFVFHFTEIKHKKLE